VVQRAGLEIHSEGLVASSIASSLAVMTDEERDLGTVMIDVGLGTVDLAVYCGGEIGHSAVLKMGGDTLVQEVARVFRIPPMEVERLILEAGIASPEFLEGEEEAERLLEAPTVAGDGVAQITRRQLAEVLEGRLLDILEWVARQIHFARRRLGLTVTSLVLTGGVSQLPGMALVAHRELDIPARVAAPCYPPSLPQMLASPIYSTSVGLVLYGATRLHRQEVRPRNVSPLRALWDKVHYSLMQLF
jgi:cell division protein FtsA